MLSSRFFNKQSGNAILMALLIVAISMELATLWFAQTQANIWRTQQMLVTDQIYLYTEGVRQWGENMLQFNNTYPIFLPATNLPIDNAIISGRIDRYIIRHSPLSNNLVTQKYATTSTPSNYFLLRTSVQLSKQKIILYTLLQQKIINKKPQVVTIWQSQGIR